MITIIGHGGAGRGWHPRGGHWLLFRPKMIEKAQELGLRAGLGFINGQWALNYCLKHKVSRLYTDRVEWLVRGLVHFKV